MAKLRGLTAIPATQGYVVKWSAAKELLRAIERIQCNQTYVSPEITTPPKGPT
jgi:hypothetical protein